LKIKRGCFKNGKKWAAFLDFFVRMEEVDKTGAIIRVRYKATPRL
jgi:hypothetical protein